jgi:hypothetical protein
MVDSITGICSGANFAPFFTTNRELLVNGFKGESIVDKRVWLQKTHYPIIHPMVCIP